DAAGPWASFPTTLGNGTTGQLEGEAPPGMGVMEGMTGVDRDSGKGMGTTDPGLVSGSGLTVPGTGIWICEGRLRLTSMRYQIATASSSEVNFAFQLERKNCFIGIPAVDSA
ncbi:MAG: hypothetical protein KDM64_15945, partial [Verrucomicrobiae bacterium]|nr:hypothetical protein [Verrucomicrobiae bacterium]